MKAMTKSLGILAALAAIALPPAAQAHWCGLRHHERPYYREVIPAVEVAPNVFLTPDPFPRHYPYIRCWYRCYAPSYQPRYYAPRHHVRHYHRPRHHASIRHWREHRRAETAPVVHAVRPVVHEARPVVHETPVVETKHVTEAPPRKIVRTPEIKQLKARRRVHHDYSKPRWYE